MRILVTGGRNYPDKARVYEVLDGLCAKHGPLTVIQGGAMGADQWARGWFRWKRRVGGKMIEEAADWDDLESPPVVLRKRRDGTFYNAAAGPVRNQRMIDLHKPGLVVAFPGGSGTADCVRRAREAGVEVVEVE